MKGFEPANGLERLLMAAADDPSQRSAFTRALLASQVCVSPMMSDSDPERITGVRSAEGADGEVLAAVFTSPERVVEAYGPDAPVMENTGRALLEWLRPGPVVLNPGLGYGVAWAPAELEALLDGMTTETLDAPLDVMLGHPTERPEALISRLSKSFAGEPVVRGAWLMLAHRGDEPEATWMMGVDHAGDWPAVQAAIRRALDGWTPDRRLDVLDIAGDPEDALRGGIPLKPADAPPKKRGLFGLFR